MATYTFFHPLERTAADEKSFRFELGFRTKWTFEFEVSRLPAGGSIELAIQVSPVSEEAQFVQLVSSGAVTTQSTVVKKGFGDLPDFTVTARDRFIRSVVVSKTSGTFVWAIRGSAPFLDVDITEGDLVGDDADLFSKELRRFEDALRIINDAELDVIDSIVADRVHGTLHAFTESDEFLPVIKSEIVEQAEHLFHREQLRRAKDPASRKSYREMGANHPLFGKRLSDFKASIDGLGATGQVWRGRG